jgi:hypothetical protein
VVGALLESKTNFGGRQSRASLYGQATCAANRDKYVRHADTPSQAIESNYAWIKTASFFLRDTDIWILEL